MYQLKKELLNYLPAFLIEDWENPNPNNLSFTIFKSTLYKDLVYHCQIRHTIKGCFAVIYRNGYPLTNFKINTYNPRWQEVAAYRINKLTA